MKTTFYLTVQFYLICLCLYSLYWIFKHLHGWNFVHGLFWIVLSIVALSVDFYRKLKL